MDFLSAENSSTLDGVVSININPNKKSSSVHYDEQSEEFRRTFSTWNEHEQVDFVENLLKHMQSHQHGQVNLYLLPMLKRDFIGRLASYGLEHVAEKILGYLDEKSLKATELVCREWYHVISEGKCK